MRISEVIVVEGRHDTARLKEYFDCDTIETGGTSLNKDVQERILHAAKTRGIIIFTDPDAPGNMIRHAVTELVPDAKHAFVDKQDARTSRKVGVEHADRKTLEEALGHLLSYTENTGELTAADMLDLGLTGRENSRQLREMVGRTCHIGYANAKTFLTRLNHRGITREELERMIHGE